MVARLSQSAKWPDGDGCWHHPGMRNWGLSGITKGESSWNCECLLVWPTFQEEKQKRQSKLETHRFHIMVSKHWHSELCIIGTFEGFVEFAVSEMFLFCEITQLVFVLGRTNPMYHYPPSLCVLLECGIFFICVRHSGVTTLTSSSSSYWEVFRKQRCICSSEVSIPSKRAWNFCMTGQTEGQSNQISAPNANKFSLSSLPVLTYTVSGECFQPHTPAQSNHYPKPETIGEAWTVCWISI